MPFHEIHFAHPWFLLAAAALPAIWLIAFFAKTRFHPRLEALVDPHLLPHLLVKGAGAKEKKTSRLVLWSIAWLSLTIALAGPRWSYREIDTFGKDQNLAILLDLSESMNAADTKPSRLLRAKQKIEDLLASATGVKIALIAFAADAHVISPLTDDVNTLRHILPSLSSSLFSVQGSRLTPALHAAGALLQAASGSNKAIWILSDGGVEDASALSSAKSLANRGVVFYATGVGTKEGAPLVDSSGNVLKEGGTPVVTALESEKLKAIAQTGGGRYFELQHDDAQEKLLLKELEERAAILQKSEKKSRLWDERFYLFILPALPLLLLWSRRGYALAGCLFLALPCLPADAALFLNSEEEGKEAFDKEAFDKEAFDKAAALFQDSYRKGVAYYKAEQYQEAENCFRTSKRPEVACQSAYNLGNALAMQNRISDAIDAYETVLAKWPDHVQAKENLELLKKLQQEKNDQKNDQDQEPPPPKQNEGEKNKGNQDKGGTPPQEEASKDNSPDQADQEAPSSKPEAKAPADPPQTEDERESDMWLNRLTDDKKDFLKNKFNIESKKQGTKKGVRPW